MSVFSYTRVIVNTNKTFGSHYQADIHTFIDTTIDLLCIITVVYFFIHMWPPPITLLHIIHIEYLHRATVLFISLAWQKTAVTPVCSQWSYCSLALSHLYHAPKFDHHVFSFRVYQAINDPYHHYGFV